MKYNNQRVTGVEDPIDLTNEANVDRALGIIKSPKNLSQRSESTLTAAGNLESQLKSVSALKSLGPDRDDLEETNGFREINTNKKHVVPNKADFLSNTAKSPIINSLRDKSNYMLSNPQMFEDIMDLKKANDRTMNRRMMVKNSYMTIFPEYGLQTPNYIYSPTTKRNVGNQIELADPVNKQYFMKMDRIKDYAEEMEKVSLMIKKQSKRK